MLDYDEEFLKARILALHYAHLVGGEPLILFMGGKSDIQTREQAELIISGFWEMVDLAIDDNHNDKEIEGVVDIEFWMHKLFIMMNGYMNRNGYQEPWDKSQDDR